MDLYAKGSTADQAAVKRLYGEALTLRAQFLFELIRNWGDVPAPLIPAYKQTDLFPLAVNRDSTYDKLLADLAIAKDLMPASGVAAAKWVRIDWANHLTTASAIDGKPLWQGFASFFTPGKNELLPFDQATIAAYQGKLKQNPGY